MPRLIRGSSTARTIEEMKIDLEKYVNNGKDPKKAKSCNNVIDCIFFNIQIEQVS